MGEDEGRKFSLNAVLGRQTESGRRRPTGDLVGCWVGPSVVDKMTHTPDNDNQKVKDQLTGPLMN